MISFGTSQTFQRKRVSARPRLQPGDAAKYIAPAAALLACADWQVVLYVRVSTQQQADGGNIDDAKAEALAWLRARSIEPLAVFAGVESSDIGGGRFILRDALDFARQHGAILVAPSRCRLLRSYLCGGGKIRNEIEPPNDGEYRMLRRMANGVPLATIIPPNEPARASQIARGQKGDKGGRPPKLEPGWKKRRREELAPRALALIEQGKSQRGIAAELAVPVSTIRDWLGARAFCAEAEELNDEWA